MINMKSVKITPQVLKGNITIPSSKSLCHRSIICAALAEGESHIDNVVFSEDIYATWECMEKLGAEIEKTGDSSLRIRGAYPKNKEGEILNCNESGSTLRFLIPIAMLSDERVSFTGRGKLVSRPLDTYYKIFEDQGIKYTTQNGNLPLEVDGRLKPGRFEIEGNISSQFISGLLFTLPLLDGDSQIIITTELESKGYVDLTLDMMSKFGIEIENKEYKEFHIKGNQRYKAKNITVEGDFSQAAFWLVCGIIGEEIRSDSLNPKSLQGDMAIVDLIKKMRGNLAEEGTSITTSASDTEGIVIDASQCPDIVPILTVLATFTKGETRIINAARLRIKESDRLKAISTELNKLGADVKELEDGLVINGVEKLKGGTVDSWNDHRIAMSLAIASMRCEGEVTITNSDAVNKSYPHFWEDFKSVGGKIDELNMGK